MKRILILTLAVVLASGVSAAKKVQPRAQLQFDPSKGEQRQLDMPQGCTVSYTAYEGMFYVTEVEDSAYQTINIYVPEGATARSPIFLRTYVGGYMAAAAAQPQAGDATGRALQEGYVVAIPGARGRNATVTKRVGKKSQTVYTGRAPKGLLDLKAAIRYLRHFAAQIPADAERIVTDGTSAGGAMSALMGATGNHPAYEAQLEAMGAAKERDDVFAAVCFCPITDLDHADAAYEWLFQCTNGVERPVTEEQRAVSAELAAQFPAYIDSLQLRTPDGVLLTSANYLDYVRAELIRAAQIAKNAGAAIPDTIGFEFSQSAMFGAPPLNGGMNPFAAARGTTPPKRMAPRRGPRQQGEYIVGLDMDTYLNYVVTTQALKNPPAFDSKGVAGAEASGENEEFGDATGSSVNFTAYSAAKVGTTLTPDVAASVALMNPMNFIDDPKAATAPHWYIRHGARDRDTSFPIPLNLALKLQNAGKNVNFLLAWNRPHSGDYALDELFQWLNGVVR